jgi:hypothetical protein
MKVLVRHHDAVCVVKISSDIHSMLFRLMEHGLRHYFTRSCLATPSNVQNTTSLASLDHQQPRPGINKRLNNIRRATSMEHSAADAGCG